MSFRPQECELRNLLKQQVLFCVGSFSNVVDSSTPRSCGRNDKGETFLRIRPLLVQCSTLPCVSSGSPRRASFPQGKLLYRIGWAPFESDGDIPGKFPGTAHRPFPTVSLMGIFFNRRSPKTFVFCSLLLKLTTSVTPITVSCHVHCYLFVDKCPSV